MESPNLPIFEKLEFGNRKQIEAIDSFINEKEVFENTYEVEFAIEGDGTVEVEASSEDEARSKAYDIIMDLEDAEINIGHVRKLSKKEE